MIAGSSKNADTVISIENEDAGQSTQTENCFCSEDIQSNLSDCPVAGPSHYTDTFEKATYEDVKPESGATPKHTPFSNPNAIDKSRQSEGSIVCEHHSFLTDITEVRQMEHGLLKLLDDFRSGKLQAFGRDCTFEKMEQVREQQERLAHLHFELNAQQELYGPQSEEGRSVGRENLGKLIENLQQLSQSILFDVQKFLL